ncbi:MAG: hypothetical protein IT374_25250 [Polyangiaceae bacterium]|nr:hypothetical protein [Polyangiaceae bacterium]
MSVAVALVVETVRMSCPYVACALAAVVTERAGVINVALEGALVVSGLATAVGALLSGSALVGLVAGVAAGAALCAGHGVAVVRGRADAIVSSIAWNLIAFALARYVLRVLWGTASSSPRVAGFAAPASPPLATLTSPARLATALAAGAVAWMFARTRFGLRADAAGEAPEAARAQGVDVARVQLVAATVAGALAALGGAHLVLDQHRFEVGMSGGRGFLALAAVLVGRHRVGPTALAAVGLAGLDAAQIALPAAVKLPPELVLAVPYVAALVIVAVAARRQRA